MDDWKALDRIQAEQTKPLGGRNRRESLQTAYKEALQQEVS